MKRAGHTEASVDLTVLAGLDPVGVLCEIVDDDGSMARLPKLRQFAAENSLKIVSIADLIRLGPLSSCYLLSLGILRIGSGSDIFNSNLVSWSGLDI